MRDDSTTLLPMQAPRVVYFDGCCEPQNPGGWMGWAWVALDRYGNEIASSSQAKEPERSNTNNIAEYLALIGALSWLQRNRFEGVLVRGDSQLVIRQMTGEYATRSPALIELHREARALAEATGARFEWVRREINQRADTYSKARLPAGIVRDRR